MLHTDVVGTALKAVGKLVTHQCDDKCQKTVPEREQRIQTGNGKNVFQSEASVGKGLRHLVDCHGHDEDHHDHQQE